MNEMRSKYEVKRQVTHFLNLAISLVNGRISANQHKINDLPSSSPELIPLLQRSTLLAAARSEIKTVIQQYMRLDGLVGGTSKS